MPSIILSAGNLTVPGDTTLNTITIADGSQGSGKVLTSDSDGRGTWSPRPTTALTTQAADYSVAPGDDVIIITADGTTITLPTAGGNSGRVVTVKFTGAFTSGVTVAPQGGDLVDGQPNYQLSAQYKFVQVISDGSGWNIIGQN